MPATQPLGTALGFLTATLLALQNGYAADFVSYADGGIAAMLGVAGAAVMTSLVRSVGAEWSARRLLRAGWRRAGGDPAQPDAAGRTGADRTAARPDRAAGAAAGSGRDRQRAGRGGRADRPADRHQHGRSATRPRCGAAGGARRGGQGVARFRHALCRAGGAGTRAPAVGRAAALHRPRAGRRHRMGRRSGAWVCCCNWWASDAACLPTPHPTGPASRPDDAARATAERLAA